MLNTKLSDLFFNYKHEDENVLVELNDDGTYDFDEEFKKSVENNAKQFFESYPEVCEIYGCTDYKQLSEDFLNRL